MSQLPRVCSHCSAIVPDGHYYCGRCGSHHAEGEEGGIQVLFYGPMQAPGRAKLILICGEAIEGMSYHLNATHHHAGRMSGVIPFEDPYISEQHADFYYVDNKIYLRDEGSVNGTFLRVRGSVPLQDYDIIRAGDHLFRFERLYVEPPYVYDDGTTFYASPTADIRFRLIQISEGGLQGKAYASPHGEVAVGREGCDLSFPDDVHLSVKHFSVSDADDAIILTDHNSKNGTFLRIRDSVQLQHGDYLFIGEQLMRVEIAV
ncbi:MAG: hypothetical protein AUK47_26940 [Deltaproteobacteria bacterium CG2_30_63_29]|nr:MAG: hypothetical protein AUK47_26940 [Deltaproteobacteria bacterium CG2_30_63_29]PJB34288.1 MAG: hypothetical protein CO108_28755 [Deltaproteobacteria bacterium CG_4_9_14_3_um_filter_63_12]